MPRSTPKGNQVYIKHSDDGIMEDFGSFDVPSPAGSLYYMYGGETDQYLDSHTSESQSPSNSLVSCA